PHVTDFDNRFLGYSVEHWTISLRARIFVHIDRIDEGRKWLDHMLAIDDGLIDPTVQFISHLGYVDLAWITGDAELAATHAAQVMEIAARHGTPYLRVFSHACAGIAMTIAGQTADAVREFEAGLAFMQSARAAVDYEPDMLAALAECLDQAGSYGKALTTAEHAIRISRERAARLPECRAQIVAGSALLKQFGVLRSVEAKRHFETAEMLIEVTGATVLEPRLRLAKGLLDSTAS
ncbi:adenylate/guanylate cyclase domain-containing protein, partial [Corallococcus exiguus]|uniref:hypothetical protein n=1 Tax=Corallococcus exiguus TaxID=83462 RepID=UPI0018082EF0